MNEHREKQTVVEEVPVGRRAVVETRRDSVVEEVPIGRRAVVETRHDSVVEAVPVGSRPVIETRHESVVEAVPPGRRPVVETRYDSVVNERQGISGVAIAALVVAGITAAVLVTMILVNSQQRNSDQELAQEKAKTLAAQQTTAQASQQPPVIVTQPSSQPATLAVPYPVPGPLQATPGEAKSLNSSVYLEIDVTSRLQKDEELRPYIIDVKVTSGTALLTGQVPNEDLKQRAEKLALEVNGVQSVKNDIAIKP